MPQPYLLRVEAINFTHAMEDTNQLSVVRGGGLGMRRAIEQLAALFDEDDDAPLALSNGGSFGLFVGDADKLPAAQAEGLISILLNQAAADGDSAAPLTQPVAQRLLQRWRQSETLDDLKPLLQDDERQLFQHLCFAQATAPLTLAGAQSDDSDGLKRIDLNAFAQANESCLAQIRWAQQQQPAVAAPAADWQPQAATICPWDGVRPANQTIHLAIGELAVSAPVAARHEFGRHGKRNSGPYRFYSSETAKAAGAVDTAPGFDQARLETLEKQRDTIFAYAKHKDGKSPFADQLGELVEGWDEPHHANKIAVIYTDGNQFSRYAREYCHSLADYQQWDRYIQAQRGRLLLELVCWLDEVRGQRRRIPLEILLWGGDELTLVVPAALALPVVERFFSLNRGLTPPLQEAQTGKPAPAISHALGLVIAHHKSPIKRLDDLARKLADRAKAQWKQQHRSELDQQRDIWHYAVLESVDTPTEPIAQFHAARYAQMAASLQPLHAASGDLASLNQAASQLRKHLPRSQLYAFCQALSRGDDAAVQQAWQRLLTLTDAEETELNGWLEQLFPTGKKIALNKTNAADTAVEGRIDRAAYWPYLHWAELMDYGWSPAAEANDQQQEVA
ncbi:MAG: hypothetical protein Tsb002_21920 [Wenzhouxiangellaceae bacterium]